MTVIIWLKYVTVVNGQVSVTVSGVWRMWQQSALKLDMPEGVIYVYFLFCIS